MHKNFGSNDGFIPEIMKPREFPMLHSHKVASKVDDVVESTHGEEKDSETN